MKEGRSPENEEKGQNSEHEIHGAGIPEKIEEVIDHNRDDQDLYNRRD